MARERETYRLELEQVLNAFPHKAVISRKELMQYTGRGRCWLDSHGFKGVEFTRTDVAHTLCLLHEREARRKRA